MPDSASLTRGRGRRTALALAVGAGALVALPSTAVAAGTNSCDASALQLSLLGQPALNPIHANPTFTPCVSADGTLVNLPELLDLVDTELVTATTRNTANVTAVAQARINGAKIGVDGIVGDVTNALLTDPNGIGSQLLGQVNGAVGAVPLVGPLLGTLLGVQQLELTGLVGALTAPLNASLQPLLPDLLSAGVIESTAQAQCVNGSPQLGGSSQYTGLTVLGQAIDPNQPPDSVLDIETAALNLGGVISAQAILEGIKIDPNGPLLGNPIIGPLLGSYDSLYALLTTSNGAVQTALGLVLLPAGGRAVVLSALIGPSSALQTALNGITIEVPAGLLNAKVTPRGQSVVGDQLTQKTLALSVTALSQPILSGVLAQARVGAGAPGCAPTVDPPRNDPPRNDPLKNDPLKNDPPKGPPANPSIKNPGKFSSPEAEAYLQCTKSPVALIDVYGVGSRTYVHGVAEKRYVGRTATIYLRHGKKKVGTAKIGSDGLFAKKVALPPAKIRRTNKARYYAVVSGKKTKALKFSRRMETLGLTATSANATFRGRVVGPLARRPKSITIKQRVTCKTYKTVATVKPDAKGRFTVKLKAPKGTGAVVYRAQTQVINNRRSTKLYPTYTLPRVVGLT